MPDAPDRVNELARDSALPISRIHYYPQADASLIERIRYGVLFVMAWWSGPSRVAFRRLTKVLAQLDPQGMLEFVVVDTDEIPEFYSLPEFVGKLAGAGETAWIKHGRIVAASGLGYHPECFVPNTRSLLEFSPGDHSREEAEEAIMLEIDATYENGVLKPLQPLPLLEHQQVRLSIQVRTSRIRQSAGLIRWKGCPEELERIAIDPEFGIEGSP